MCGTWRHEECVRKFGAGGKTLMPKMAGGHIGRS
jgi:putative transposon-encoded protein